MPLYLALHSQIPSQLQLLSVLPKVAIKTHDNSSLFHLIFNILEGISEAQELNIKSIYLLSKALTNFVVRNVFVLAKKYNN